MAIRRDTATVSTLKRRQERLRKILRRQLRVESLEDRRVFASPQLVSINPNNSDFFNLTSGANTRNIAPRELTFRFNDGQVINPASVTLAANNLRVSRAGVDGALGTADDIVITPGYVGVGEAPNEVVLRFKENLPDDVYRVTLIGAGAAPITNAANEPFNNGVDQTVNFELDLGAQVVSVVPQPVDRTGSTWTQRTNQIDVYFNNDDLDPALAQNVSFYKLIFTKDTVSNTDDTSFSPISAVYNAAQDKVTLTFAQPLHLLSTGAGTYRLRIGTNETIPTAPSQISLGTDPGSSFASSQDLGLLGGTGTVVSAAVEAQPYDLVFPGAITEPGHRDVPLAEAHLSDDDADTTGGVPRLFYNFQASFNGGFINYITEAQKQRAREIFEIYSRYAGIDFVETATQGLTVATADLASMGGVSGPGGVAGLGGGGAAVMDVAELAWNDDYGGSWFDVAMHEIGHALGLGHTYDLPPGTNMGDDPLMGFGQQAEPIFPGVQDIVHWQYLYRPDSNDIDLYKFQVTTTGSFTAETFAERLSESSSLNSVLRLYRDVNGVRTLVAQNDDYYSEDSFLKLQLQPGIYYVGVSSTGNDDYDPIISNTGLGGTSQGAYQLRLNFRADVTNTLADTTGVAFDGDLDGVAGGVYDFWFKVAAPAQTIFVDKMGSAAGTGSLSNPYNNIQSALSAAVPGSIVRLLGNGGADNNLLTTTDTVPYQIGSDPSGNPLVDGRTLEVPKGVTLMIDAGAVFKSRRGSISVGSNSATNDRSGGALQVLGTPVQSVFFTSYNDDSFSGNTNNSPTPAAPGNWGGIIFQNESDRANQRFDYEQQGIFLNYVNHADIRYGGGSVSISGVEQIVAPIFLTSARPTITFNSITLSADAAISADPNSFEETNFHAPIYQRTAVFTSDYDRVGPDIYGNRLFTTTTVNNVTTSQANSINGLFVRLVTLAGQQPQKLTTTARFDDLDIVHVIAENLIIEGTPGGGLQDLELPDVSLITLAPQSGGTLAAGTYTYKITYVDLNGNESAPSANTSSVNVAANSSIILDNLPAATAGYVARRIYRSFNGGVFQLAAQVVSNTTTYVDTGTLLGGNLSTLNSGIRARTDARLAIDPGVIVKMNSARIEAAMGSQFIAEGTAALPVVITSINDDRYGAGHTFDQTGTNTPNTPARGNWGGIFLGPMSSGSIDHAVIAYGGGTVRIAGTDTAYNVLEVYQAEARVAHSVFEQNASGQGGVAPASRFGAGANSPATIFVRGAQPIIIDNIIRNNAAAAININTNSLDHQLISDYGRTTGAIDRLESFEDNHGALIRLNALLNNDINGMVVRGETMQTEGVWDDTDIAHVLLTTIYIANFHTFGGLRIQSSQTESLVVKLQGQNAGITATGKQLDIDDRIGGMLHVIGQPGRPVIFTSLRDDTVGAGKRPDGKVQSDTNNDGTASTAAAGDWRSLLIDQFAHDRNVGIAVESEAASGVSPGSNSAPAVAQALGSLTSNEANSDENLRLGYIVHGFLNARNDVDVYSFSAKAGTEVWLDIDQSRIALDAVLELVDADGVTLARSNDSVTESAGTTSVLGLGMTMQKVQPYNGVDYWGINTRDPGMRVVLPGGPNTTNTYYVRVRSNGPLLAGDLAGGLTSGAYELQIRTREIDEKAGTSVTFANISYATNGIEVYGQPTHSQLVGESGENLAPNDTLGTATNIGNILNTDRMAMSIAGSLGKAGGAFSALADVDFYRFDVRYAATQQIAGITPGSIFSTIFDVDYADRVQNGDVSLWLFNASGTLILGNRSSNVVDDLGRANKSDDTSDLSRGTTSTFDPYIGAQVLPEGTYYVAVTANSVSPTALTQAQVRLEPINSLIRIADDHIGGTAPSTFAGPIVPQLVDGTSAVPWFLGDVSMFVTQERTGLGQLSTRLLTVDPFTGRVETVVNNNLADSRTSFSWDIGDIAFRRDGSLITFSVGNDTPNSRSDANSGNYLQINTGTGVVTSLGDDGIITYEPDPTNPVNPVVANLQPNQTRIGYGIQFQGITFFIDGNNVEHVYAIGNRGDSVAEGLNRNNGVSIKENILYEFNTQTGAVLYNTGVASLGGAATQVLSYGEILTAPRIEAPDATTLVNNAMVRNLRDGNILTVTDGAVSTVYEFDAGYDIVQAPNIANGQSVRDGNFFVLDGKVFQINTGSVIEINVNGSNLTDGVVVAVNTGTRSASFEFDNSPPASAGPPPIPATPQFDPTATPIRFGPGTTSIQLAGLLANAINAATLTNAAGLPLTAAAVGNRVTLINELTAELRLPPAASPNEVIVAGDANAAPIVQVSGAIDSTLDGKIFSVQVVFQQGGPAQTVTFEFDNNGVSGDNGTSIFAVPFTNGMTPAQVATNIRQAALTAANAGWPITTQLANDKVVFNGRSAAFGISTDARVTGLTNIQLINVEESDAAAAIGAATKTVVNLAVNAPLQSGAEYTRINFINAAVGEFYVNTWNVQADSLPGVSPGNVPIPFLIDWTPTQLASNGPVGQPATGGIAVAINGANPTINAQASGAFVRLGRGSAVAQLPVITQGEGPGGVITGMTQVGGSLYAVSNNGGLYRLNQSINATFPSVTTTYIQTSREDLVGIEFSSLTRGPQNVEGGRYANMLFATDVDGRIYAFNTAGELQPIFVNGATSVASGLTDVNGLAFSELDRNLFTQTTNRGTDAGHGITPAFDGSRPAREGGNSVYFGDTNTFNYNYNGGAYGSLVTNEFSLKGYSSSDQPTLYFNYYLQGDGTTDAFKVFVGSDTGDWQLLNTTVASSGQWRQIRVSLGGVAGLENLRLKFDFSTAGELNVGDIFTTGDELRAVAAKYIDDGDVFSIDNIDYEFELGPIIQADSGASMRDGETFTLTTTTGAATFEFDNNNALVNGANRRITFNTVMTPTQVANAIRSAITAAGLGGVTVHQLDNLVNIKGLVSFAQAAPVGLPRLRITGDVGVDPTNVPIDINLSMNRNEVATAIDGVLERTLAEQRLVAQNGTAYNTDGLTFTLDDDLLVPGAQTFEFDTGFVLQIPALGTNPGGITDGQFFKISNDGGLTKTVLVFDTNGTAEYVVQAGETVQYITIAPSMPQSSVARAVEFALNAAGLGGMGILPLYLDSGRVQLGGNATVTLDLTGTPSLTSAGTPGVAPGNVRIYVSPTVAFTAGNVATAIATAFNTDPNNTLALNYTARVDAFDQRRVFIEKNDPTAPDLTFAMVGTQVTLENTNNISKQYKDLLRIIGHSVTDSGPLGFEASAPDPVFFYAQEGVNTALGGDVLSYPYYDPSFAGLPNRRVGFNSPVRGQNNGFEGFYLDDILIGFADRGEIVTAAAADSTFQIPGLNAAQIAQLQATNDAISFPYQLEVRSGQDYADNDDGNAILLESFDTNTRLTNGYELTMPAGSALVDGQFFILTDGVNQVRFEFDDLRSQTPVTPGSVRLPFNSTDPDYVIAYRLREAINSSSSQSLLPSITAAFTDGTLSGALYRVDIFGFPILDPRSGLPIPVSSDAKVVLTGPASLRISATTGLTVTGSTTSGNALRDVLLGTGATPVGNAVLVSGFDSAGTFANGNVIGMDSGIILSTGSVFDAEGPNASDGSTGFASGLTDTQLNNTFGVFTEDTTSLTFQFLWGGGNLNFDFVFASEEYNEFANSTFNDVFAFYLSGGALAAAENLAVIPGTSTPVSINTINGGDPLGTGAVNPGLYNNNDPSDGGPSLATFGYDGYTEVLTASRAALPAGVYTIKLAISDVGDSSLDSAVFLGARSFGGGGVLTPPEGVPGRAIEYKGDSNRTRDQGQILLSSNYITNSSEYGMVIDAGQRTRADLAPGAGTGPNPGVVRNLRTINGERLIPGVVATNNVISTSGQGGIHLSGDPNVAAPTQLAPVPFARVVNNTIYGGGAGIGINVDQNASPTLMNNIVANLATGVVVDASSSSTVLTGMLYSQNGVNTQGTGLGSFPIQVAAGAPLFVNAATGNFYLAAGSQAIDSSVDNLPDRNNFVTYKAQVGIGASPILSPDRDVTGQLRQDDPSVEPPAGIGNNVFKDRGALDRVDFSGPTAVLTTPRDNDSNGLDQNPSVADVLINGVTYSQFTVQLLEGLDPFESQNGSGIDDSSIDPAVNAANAAKVSVTRGSTVLVLGVDYTFSYDATNDTLIFVPLTGLWATDTTYVITLDNSATGIMDLAGNSLKPNRGDGSTTFTITLGNDTTPPAPFGIDFGDAPDPSYASLLSSNGARHIINPAIFLGAVGTGGVSQEANARPNNGDTQDDGVTFSTGSQIIRGRQDVGVTVVASQAGILDAWFDFNANGVFETTEKMFTSNLVAGPNTLFVDVPLNATLGTIYARFRFSTAGNLAPTGLAQDGEVEDYALNIIPNPWQNPNAATDPSLRFDVNGDGAVSPLDALIIINRLNYGGQILGIPLPGEVPPYVDVDGNGFLEPKDAKDVIDELNRRPPEVQGEAAVASVDVNPTASATSAAVAGATGTSFAVAAASSAPAAMPLDVTTSNDTAAPTAVVDDAGFDFSALDAADDDYLPFDVTVADDDSDDVYDAVLGGGDGAEEADDFFAWFGQ